MAFTIWWHDGEAAQIAGVPSGRPLRVRVIVQNHIDHATISFFIDAGKPWNQPQVFSLAEAEALGGSRRIEIFRHVETIRNICEERDALYLEADLQPELGLSDDQRKGLFEASDYCYRQVWLDFRQHFGLQDLSEILKGVKVFADFRGLVISATGFDEDEEKSSDIERVRASRLERRKSSASTGLTAFKRFDHESGPRASREADGRRSQLPAKKNEPNAVLKAYWPFIRRITPWADYKEFVACGVMNWRALYVTSMGMPAFLHGDDESESRTRELLGSDCLPETKAWLYETLESRERWPDAEVVRYLFITKHEPNSRQIGRIVERVNALGTMRLFALKDWSAIRNASTHIRALGQELDQVFGEWLSARKKIQTDFNQIRSIRLDLNETEDLLNKKKSELHKQRKSRASLLKTSKEKKLEADISKLEKECLELSETLQQQEDVKTERLEYQNNLAEENLIEIGANLDRIGPRATGGLVYCIARAEYHIDEFVRMAERLRPNAIDTWVSYDQFVDRGLKPSFDFIKSTGTRLRSLRGRLQVVTESVQTAALVLQTSATRSNTAELRKIANSWRRATLYSQVTLVVVVLSIAGALFKDELIDGIKHLLKPGFWHSIHGAVEQVQSLLASLIN